MTRVYLHHMRDKENLWYCLTGIRSFFRRHGLDYRDFLENGIDAEALEKTGDEMAMAAVRVAREQQ